MKRLKWLYPGMLVKRWISLAVFGILMISMGFVIVISEPNPDNKAVSGFIIILGIVCVVLSVKRILKSFMAVLAPSARRPENRLVDRVFEEKDIRQGA